MTSLQTTIYETHGLCLLPRRHRALCKGPCWKWVMPFFAGQERPPILPIWPVKIGTNHTRLEIFTLENASFQLSSKERITPIRLFTNSAPPLDMSKIRVHKHPNFIPPTRLSKVVRRSSSAPLENKGGWLPLLKLCMVLF